MLKAIYQGTVIAVCYTLPYGKAEARLHRAQRASLHLEVHQQTMNSLHA
jgi:hypothetical protein